MINFVHRSRLLLIISIVFAAHQVQSAENLSTLAQAVQAITPAYVSKLSITETDTLVRISGEVASNEEVSRYMRLLAERVAMPNLESVQRQDSISVFILTLRK